jgi:Domain of unknown function (DUF4440)
VKLRSTLSVLLLIGLTHTAAAEQCSGNVTAEEATAAENARYTAQTSNDFAAMERLFGEDLHYNHSSNVVDTKASYIESMRSGDVRYRVMNTSDTKVRTYGCVAIITGVGEYEVTVKGKDMSVQIRFHAIWAKRAGGLQFISWQATRFPPKQ